MATKKSLYDIAQMWNEWNEAGQEPDMELLERTITENGYVSDCHEQWGICHSDTEEVRLMDDLTAMVFDREI